jgi:hypothetical protein
LSDGCGEAQGFRRAFMRKPMKSRSLVVPARFLQAVIVLVGIGALALLLWEPHIEGRNANATLFEIYFKDAFLAYAYLASIPFFVALFQAIKALSYIGRNMAFSPATTRALRVIAACALTTVGLVALGVLFIFLGDSDDRAGGVFIGVLIALGSVVVAAVATMFERVLQSAVSSSVPSMCGELNDQGQCDVPEQAGRAF